MGRKKYTDPKFAKKFSDIYRRETTAEVSDKLDVKQQTINDWKKGISFPDVATLIAISKDRNVSLDYLLGDAPRHTLDGDYKSASMVTGLNETTIKALKERFDGYGALMLNRFVESGHYEAMMITLFKSIKIITRPENEQMDVPTEQDWIGFYANEMSSVLRSFLWDVLSDLADADIGNKILARITEHIKSLTPDQMQARKDIWGDDFIENLIDEIRKDENEV